MCFTNCVYWVIPVISNNIAGFRVRIKPIADELNRSGIKVEIVTQDQLFDKKDKIIEENAIAVFSKPSDSNAYISIRYLLDNGIKVVVDLFDNYFAWSAGIANTQIYWNLLRIIDITTGVVVSTPFLKGTIESLFGRTVHIAQDPAKTLPIEFEKNLLEKWNSPDCYEFLWFGIHTNPYFIAGLDDVMSWTSVLADLQTKLFPKKIRVTLCTNPVEGLETTLAHLRRHSIEAFFIPWSDAECNLALAKSHIVMIPTNLSGFSRAKTHNRCSDALTYRCVVLTNPHSPYQDIPGAIFTNTDLLVRSLEKGITTVLPLIEMSLQFVSAQFSVSNIKLAYQKALEGAAKRPKKLNTTNAKILVAGETNAKTIKLSRNYGYLTGSFTGNSHELNFDVVYEGMTIGDRLMHFSFSSNGLVTIIEKLRLNFDTDWIEKENLSTCKLANARLYFDTEKCTCDLDAPNFIAAANEIEQIRSLVKHSPSLKGRWIDINIAFLLDFFLLLGYSDIDLASDTSAGWAPYIERIAPQIGDLGKDLNQNWLTQTGATTRIKLDSEIYTW